MARTRSIKPGFFLNDRLAELNPLTRILFAGLWCIADREGRMEDRAKKIKAAVLPYDDHDVDNALEELQKSGFITRYRFQNREDKKYIQIMKFLEHQNPHTKEPPSTIPAPGKQQSSTRPLIPPPTRAEVLLTPPLDPDHLVHPPDVCAEPFSNGENAHAPTNGSGVNLMTCRRGVEWEVPEGKIAEWEESYPDVDVRLTLLGIRQWLRDNPSKRKTSQGMPRFLNAWMMREQDKPDPQYGKTTRKH